MRFFTMNAIILVDDNLKINFSLEVVSLLWNNCE